MSLVKRILALWRTGTKFLLVGGLSTLIEIGVLNILLYMLGWNASVLGLVAAKIIASLVALINAYFGNREWAFRGRERRTRRSEITWFLIVNAFCLVLGAVLFWVGVEIGELILGRALGPFAINFANLVSIAIVVMVRFVLYHKVVFRATPKPPIYSDDSHGGGSQPPTN